MSIVQSMPTKGLRRLLPRRWSAAGVGAGSQRNGTSLGRKQALSTLSYLPKLHAAIPEALPAIRRLVDEYEVVPGGWWLVAGGWLWYQWTGDSIAMCWMW